MGPVSDDDYYTIRAAETAGSRTGGPNPMRAAVLFATVAIALTVLAVPHIGSQSRFAARQPLDLDPIMTGSIGQPSASRSGFARGTQEPTRTYVVRRSVLTGGSVCVLGQDGSRSGAC